MSSVFRSRQNTAERSGGKIVKSRQVADTAKTPYDRPASAVRAPPRNPNLLTGLIFPTSRMIASGATKLLSSVFGPDTSSSSSSSGVHSLSENSMDDENDDHDVTSGSGGGLNKNGTTSELIECFRTESRGTLGTNETKRVIEKLLLQETFSRKEADRLIKILNSRVMYGCTMEEGQDGKLGDIPTRTVGDDIPELCSKAIMEAKQWLEEKKASSSSKFDLDRGTCALSSVAPSQITESEIVSPVDIAKVYMRARPPWTSLAIDCVETGTPSQVRRELLKDETSCLVAGSSFSSSKQKVCSLSSGPWNIQEEIRRVRSNATEDMLKTSSSTVVDLSKLSTERKSVHKPLLADETDWALGDKVHSVNLFPATTSIDAPLELASGASTCRDLPASALTHNSPLEEDLSSQPIIFSSAQNQDLEGLHAVVEGHPGSNPCHPTIPDLALEHDSRLTDTTYSSSKEEAELRGNLHTNGFPISASSFAAGDDEQNLRPSDDNSPRPVSSSLDNLVNRVPVKETCELLSEASMEVPVMNETNDTSAAAGGNEKISSMDCEELSQELTQPNLEDGLTEKTTTVVEKQQGRKPSGRYTRKSRKGWM